MATKIVFPQTLTLIPKRPLPPIAGTADLGELVVAANPAHLAVDLASQIDCSRLSEARSLPSQGSGTGPYSTAELKKFADQLKIKKNLPKAQMVKAIREAIGCP